MPENLDDHGNFVPAGTSSPSGFSVVPNPASPISPEDQQGAEAQHQKYLRSIDAEQPGNLYYQKPQAAARARAKAEDDMAALRARFGLAKPVPKSPEQVAAERFEQEWRGPPELSADTMAMMDVELDRLKENGAAFAAGAADLQKKFGPEGYAKLIAQAKLAMGGKPWRREIEASPPVLKLLASRGRYFAAHEAAKAKQK